MEDRCVCCGEVIPEGRMVCPVCEENTKHYWDQLDYEYEMNRNTGIPVAITILVSILLWILILGILLTKAFHIFVG